MKKTFILLATAMLMIASSNVNAQGKSKLGHIDFGQLYRMMPGLDSIREIFNAYQQTIEDQYAAMQVEYENKINEYQAGVGTMSNIIRQTKEAELQDLAARMDAFEVQAAEDLQNKELELTTPIIEEARAAVEEVAKENGYKYIFNSTEGLILYAEPSDDVMDLVKKKLNITGKVPPSPGGDLPIDPELDGN